VYRGRNNFVALDRHPPAETRTRRRAQRLRRGEPLV